jgi:hypothetical protein
MGQTNKWPHHSQDSIINNQLQKTSASRFLTRILIYPHECFWFLSCGFKKMTKFQSCSDYLSQQNPSQVQQTAKSLRKQQAIIVVCSSSFVFFHLVALQNETQQRRRSYSKKIQFMQYKHNNALPGF